VPASVLFGALDKCIKERRHHRELFQSLSPGFDVDAARRVREASGNPDLPDAADIYPDAALCITALQHLNIMVGVAANQPARAVTLLESFGIVADMMASSEAWGIEKPSPAFFERICSVAGLQASQIAYVGDRVDNDVLPALGAGMTAVFLRRGPWARIQADWAEARLATVTIDSLSELVPALASQLG